MKKSIILVLTSLVLFTGCNNKTNIPKKELMEKEKSTYLNILENSKDFINSIIKNNLLKKDSKNIENMNEEVLVIKIFEQHNEYNDDIKTVELIKKRLYLELDTYIKIKLKIKANEIYKITSKEELSQMEMFFLKLSEETMEVVLQTIEFEKAKLKYEPNGILCYIEIDNLLLEKNLKDFLEMKMNKLKENRFEMK